MLVKLVVKGGCICGLACDDDEAPCRFTLGGLVEGSDDVGCVSSTVSEANDCTELARASSSTEPNGVTRRDSKSFDQAQSRARSAVGAEPPSSSACCSRRNPCQFDVAIAFSSSSSSVGGGCTPSNHLSIAFPMPIMTRRSSAISLSASRSVRGGGLDTTTSISGMVEKPSEEGGEKVRNEKAEVGGAENSGRFLWKQAS